MQIIRHPATNFDGVFNGCLACGSSSVIVSRTHYSLYNATACSERCRVEVICALKEITGLLEWLKAPAASLCVRQSQMTLDLVDKSRSTVFRFSESVRQGEPLLSAWETLDRRVRKQCRDHALSSLKEMWHKRKTANRLFRHDHQYIQHHIQKIKTNRNEGGFPNASVMAAASVYMDLQKGELRNAVLTGHDRSDIAPSSLTPVSVDINEWTVGILAALGIDGDVGNKTSAEIRRMARRAVASHHPDRGGDRRQFESCAVLLQQLKSALAGPRFLSNSGHRAGTVQGLPGAFCYAPDSGPWFNPLPSSILAES